MQAHSPGIVAWVLSCFSRIQLFVTLQTLAHQAPLSIGFSRQEYWTGLPCPPPRNLPDKGLNPHLSCLLHLRAGSLPLPPPGKSMKAKVTQSCPTLCDAMDYTVHGILQARILEWVAFPLSRLSSQPRDRTQVSSIASGFFSWATREAQEYWSG